MALIMLIFGAVMVVAGIAMVSTPAAVVCAGVLAMAAAFALAAVQDQHQDTKAAVE